MTALTALVLFAGLTLVLMFTYVNFRVLKVLGGMPANSWGRDLPSKDPAFVVRAHHAHLNMVENLPVFAAIVLAAYAMGKSAVVDPVAMYVFYLRLGQVGSHLIGTSHWLVMARATFFTGQVLLMFWMIWGLLN